MAKLIYNQKAIPRDQWRYGLRASADTGCGWIATYNALQLMGHTVDIAQLIRYYERQLPLINGNTGTALWGPALRFRRWGFPVTMSIQRTEFDRIAKESDACILFYRWRKKWKLGAHFVALHHTPQGFIGYNTFTTSTGPDPYGESLNGFLKKRGYFGAVLFGIRNRRPS